MMASTAMALLNIVTLISASAFPSHTDIASSLRFPDSTTIPLFQPTPRQYHHGSISKKTPPHPSGHMIHDPTRPWDFDHIPRLTNASPHQPHYLGSNPSRWTIEERLFVDRMRSAMYWTRWIEHDFHAMDRGERFSDELGCRFEKKGSKIKGTRMRVLHCMASWTSTSSYKVDSEVIRVIAKRLNRKVLPVEISYIPNVPFHQGRNGVDEIPFDYHVGSLVEESQVFLWKLLIGDCNTHGYGNECMQVWLNKVGP